MLRNLGNYIRSVNKHFCQVVFFSQFDEFLIILVT